MVRTFRDVIGLWPSPDALAGEIGARVETVRKWRQRDRIPPEWWEPVIQAAQGKGQQITADEIAGMAARKAAQRREGLTA